MKEMSSAVGGLSFIAVKPIAILMKLAGLTEVFCGVSALLQILGSFVDAVAVYVLMAALTTTLELELQGQAWFNTFGK